VSWYDAFNNVAAKNGSPKDEGPIIGHLVKHRVYEDIKNKFIVPNLPNVYIQLCRILKRLIQ
jgi:hypothetical protein